jgi:hypothetical protein
MAAGKALDATSARPILMVVCSVVLLAALILGVGIPNHMVLRHIVQMLPVWGVVFFGARRSQTVGLIGLPVFVFWLGLMSLIWGYLLGLLHLVSGDFSAWEISMTIVVGFMCIIGIAASVRLRSSAPAFGKAAMLVVVAFLQFLCFRISFLPAIAHR